MRAGFFLSLSLLLLGQIPPENSARLTHAPPRPAWGDADERHVASLFTAIQRDDPSLASDFFFPHDAFMVLKGIADPGGYWTILHRHYERDIHALHAVVPGGARYARFEPKRATWQAMRTEANALPYWAVRHSLVHYTVDGADRTFELHVIIDWGPRWYVTHLS
jgi:hypothetical protein